jgi:hypothetical protein
LRQGRPDLDEWLGVVSVKMVEHGGRTAVDASAAAVGALREISARQASVLAYADVFRVMAVIGIVALLFVPLMSPPPKPPPKKT